MKTFSFVEPGGHLIDVHNDAGLDTDRAAAVARAVLSSRHVDHRRGFVDGAGVRREAEAVRISPLPAGRDPVIRFIDAEQQLHLELGDGAGFHDLSDCTGDLKYTDGFGILLGRANGDVVLLRPSSRDVRFYDGRVESLLEAGVDLEATVLRHQAAMCREQVGSVFTETYEESGGGPWIADGEFVVSIESEPTLVAVPWWAGGHEAPNPETVRRLEKIIDAEDLPEPGE